MARFLDLDRETLVFDLVWQRMSAVSRKAIGAAARGATMAVAVTSKDSDHTVGFLHSSPADKSKKRLVSFAALVAQNVPSAQDKALLLFLELEGNEAIVVGVRAGLPVPDFDRYGHRDDLASVAYDFLRDNPDARIVGNTREFDQCEEFDLQDFIKTKATKKAIAAASLKSVSGPSRAPLLALVTVCFAAFVAYDGYQEKKRKEEALKAAAQQVDPIVVYRNALPAAIASEGMASVDAAKLLDKAKTLEVLAAGWSAGQVKCSANGCDLTWSRQSKVSTVGDIIAAVGKDSARLINDQTVVQHIGFAAAPARIDLGALKAEQETLIGVLEPLQRLGEKVGVGITLPVKFAAGGVTPPGAIARGEIRLQGPIWALDSLRLLPKHVLVREFTLSTGAQGATFNATIIYFTK